MSNREALIKAREIITENLKANNTPKRADITQLTNGYPMEHAITVLGNLINLFPEEEV